MSIGRSITKKSSRYGFGSSSSLEDYSRRHSVSKHQISAPVALLSTTNMLSYTAPSLRTSLSQASISSGSSSSGSPTSLRSPLSPSFADDSDRCDLPLPNNHLSAYFTGAEQLLPSRSQSTRDAPKASSPIGRRPRHPSMPPPPSSAQPPKELHSAARASGHHHHHHHQHHHQQHSLPPQHPFGAELAQVAEMTEEIAGLSVNDAEEQFMRSRGLRRFRASDYEQEIWLGMGGVFEDQLPSFGAGWI